MASSADLFTHDIQEILGKLDAFNQATSLQAPGAREKLLALSHQLTAALETPSETIQRMGWAEVRDPMGFITM